MAIKMIGKKPGFIGIDEMRKMTNKEYRHFLQQEGLVMVNHHDVLSSSISGYAIAATKEQLDIYIEELRNIRDFLE